MNAKLTTHVLDTYHGKPASGVIWTLEFEKSNLSEEVKLFKSRKNILNSSINAAREILEIENFKLKKMEIILEEGAVSQFEFLQKKIVRALDKGK